MVFRCRCNKDRFEGKEIFRNYDVSFSICIQEELLYVEEKFFYIEARILTLTSERVEG